MRSSLRESHSLVFIHKSHAQEDTEGGGEEGEEGEEEEEEEEGKKKVGKLRCSREHSVQFFLQFFLNS